MDSVSFPEKLSAFSAWKAYSTLESLEPLGAFSGFLTLLKHQRDADWTLEPLGGFRSLKEPLDSSSAVERMWRALQIGFSSLKVNNLFSRFEAFKGN